MRKARATIRNPPRDGSVRRDRQTGGVQRLSDKLLSWASILDEETLKQAERTAMPSLIHPHIAFTESFTA